MNINALNFPTESIKSYKTKNWRKITEKYHNSTKSLVLLNTGRTSKWYLKLQHGLFIYLSLGLLALSALSYRLGSNSLGREEIVYWLREREREGERERD